MLLTVFILNLNFTCNINFVTYNLMVLISFFLNLNFTYHVKSFTFAFVESCFKRCCQVFYIKSDVAQCLSLLKHNFKGAVKIFPSDFLLLSVFIFNNVFHDRIKFLTSMIKSFFWWTFAILYFMFSKNKLFYFIFVFIFYSYFPVLSFD